jgi:hypothetical protein
VARNRAAKVQRGEGREQERNRQHDPEIEQVDEAVERIAGAVLSAAGVWVTEIMSSLSPGPGR